MVLEKVAECCKVLAKGDNTISCVESASAGRMSYEFSLARESGKVLIGGIVCYNACLKQSALNIPHDLIEMYTAESAEVTKAMAHEFYKTSQSDVCVALTGLTTAGGSETPDKPVGTIFIHIIMPHKQIGERFTFQGSPEGIIRQAVEQTATIVTKQMQ